MLQLLRFVSLNAFLNFLYDLFFIFYSSKYSLYTFSFTFLIITTNTKFGTVGTILVIVAVPVCFSTN